MANELGWLIECGGNNGVPLKYFDGLGWTEDQQEAVRFARKIDGERVRTGLDSEHEIRVAEHMWCDGPADQAAQRSYLFFRAGHFYPVNCRDDADARKQAELNPGTERVESVEGEIIWPEARH